MIILIAWNFFHYFFFREAIEMRRNRGPPFIILLPLIYAPILPLSTLSFLNLYFDWILFLCIWFVCLNSIYAQLTVSEFLCLKLTVRIGLRRKPVLRDRLFFGVLAGAFAHGTYLVYPTQLCLLFCFSSF